MIIGQRRTNLLVLGVILSLLAPVLTTGTTLADSIENSAFSSNWDRTDHPVADGKATRTWIWGDAALTGAMQEPYAEAPGGTRTVQYFDKSRMEITNPSGDSGSVWYVTNGLLVVELVTGRMQVGGASYETRSPAQINVVGDEDYTAGPTYASFANVLTTQAAPLGGLVASQIQRDGSITDFAGASAYNIHIAVQDDVTKHAIAQPFWDFMNSSGVVYKDGHYATDQLFMNPYFATGRPIVEPYWATVKVLGTVKDVLVQCFERRCLTYTPDIPAEWQVEAGNVGRHYYAWRYQPADTIDIPANGASLYASTLLDRPSAEVEQGRFFVLDDTYHVQVNSQNILGDYLDSVDPYGATRVDLDVRLVGDQNPEASACLMTRLDPEDLLSDIAFCLSANGWTSAFYEQVDSGNADSLLPPAQRNGALNPNEWITLSIINRDNDVWFLINDELVGTAAKSGPTVGYVGYYVDNRSSASVEFEFTNLNIWAVE